MLVPGDANVPVNYFLKMPALHWADLGGQQRVSIKPENVTLTALKKSEDVNGLIYRMYEWAGKGPGVRIHLPPATTAATDVNLLDKSGGHLPDFLTRITCSGL